MKQQGSKLVARRVLATALAVSTSWAMVGPSFALAADGFVFEGGEDYYTDASANDEGTFSWDGADDFVMDNYQGVGFVANGDANLEVRGDSAVDGSIGAVGGDLTVTGGTLDASEEGGAALFAVDGDVTIDNATVNAQSKDTQAAIAALNGDVNIKGATVNATNESSKDDVVANGILAIDGSVNISDSTVDATSTGGSDQTAAILAYGYYAEEAPEVNINNSFVHAESDWMSITAFNENNADAPGQINIEDSVIVDPYGAHVQDLLVDYTYGDGSKGMMYGQTIGKGEGVITDLYSDDIVSSVTIAPARRRNTAPPRGASR